MLQENLGKVSTWLRDWRIKANENKSVQVTFTLRHDTCPTVNLNGITIPQSENVRYLGIHLDRRLTWKKHILTKRKALSVQFRKLYWLLARNSNLSLHNKLLLYKIIVKPVWSYGVELWGTAAKSNLDIVQRFQSKMLRTIANAPWFVTNSQLHRDLMVPTVKEEILGRIKTYTRRLESHPNELACDLMESSRVFKRIKRRAPQDLLLS